MQHIYIEWNRRIWRHLAICVFLSFRSVSLFQISCRFWLKFSIEHEHSNSLHFISHDRHKRKTKSHSINFRIRERRCRHLNSKWASTIARRLLLLLFVMQSLFILYTHYAITFTISVHVPKASRVCLCAFHRRLLFFLSLAFGSFFLLINFNGNWCVR